MAISAPSPHAPNPPPAPRAGRDPGVDPPVPRRPLGRHRSLPGSRAVVGGLLVVLAALGAFLVATSSASAPRATVVVATRPIGVGEVLAADDLRTIEADLPDPALATVFRAPPDLLGAVAVAPIGVDQPVPRSAVSPDAGARTHDLSFAIERHRALNGRLRPGDRVDLVATSGTGSDSSTTFVVRAIPVVDVDAPTSNGASSSATITITLAFDAEDDVLRAANALETATVSLVRSTGTPADGATAVNDAGADRSTPSTTSGTGTDDQEAEP